MNVLGDITMALQIQNQRYAEPKVLYCRKLDQKPVHRTIRLAALPSQRVFFERYMAGLAKVPQCHLKPPLNYPLSSDLVNSFSPINLINWFSDLESVLVAWEIAIEETTGEITVETLQLFLDMAMDCEVQIQRIIGYTTPDHQNAWAVSYTVS